MDKQDFYKIVIREKLGSIELEEASQGVSGSSYNWFLAIKALSNWEMEVRKIIQPRDNTFHSYSRLLYEADHLKGIHRNNSKIGRDVLGEIEKIIDALVAESIEENFQNLKRTSSLPIEGDKLTYKKKSYSLTKTSSLSTEGFEFPRNTPITPAKTTSHSPKTSRNLSISWKVPTAAFFIILLSFVFARPGDHKSHPSNSETHPQDHRLDETNNENNNLDKRLKAIIDSEDDISFVNGYKDLTPIDTAEDCDGLDKTRLEEDYHADLCSLLISRRGMAKWNMSEVDGAREDALRAIYFSKDNCYAIALHGILLSHEGNITRQRAALDEYFRALECYKKRPFQYFDNLSWVDLHIANIYGQFGNCNKKKEHLRIAALAGNEKAQREYPLLNCK